MSETSKAHCDTSVSASAPANQEYWNDAQPAYPLGSSSTYLENSGNYIEEHVKEKDSLHWRHDYRHKHQPLTTISNRTLSNAHKK